MAPLNPSLLGKEVEIFTQLSAGLVSKIGTVLGPKFVTLFRQWNIQQSQEIILPPPGMTETNPSPHAAK